MAKISIHIFIEDLDSVLKSKNRLKENLDRNTVTYLWYTISRREDLTKIRNILKYVDITPAFFIKDFSLLPEVLKEKSFNIVFQLESFKPSDKIIQYKELFSDNNSSIILTFNRSGYMDEIDREGVINLFEKSINILRNAGVKNITLHYENYEDILDMIDIYRVLKERFNLPLLVPFRNFLAENDTMLVNSLVIGNLFYGRFGDSILVKYGNINEFSENIKNNTKIIRTILGSLGLVKTGYTIISCPKCGRCQMDLLKINEEVDEYLNRIEKEYNSRGVKLEDIGGITVAVMGCNVNGPGEARGADIGIAGGKNGYGTIFKYGVPFKTLPEKRVVDELIHHVKNIIDKKIKDSGLKVS